MSQKHPRPLAPAAPLYPAVIPGPTLLPSPSKQRRNITTACRACRKRRTKCDDNTPCAACVAKRTDCIREAAEDGRRRMAWKRKVEELESDQRLLPDLMEAIRTGDNGQVENLVGMIRTTASNEEVSNYLAANFPHAEEDESRSKASTRQQSPQSSASRFSRTNSGQSAPSFKVPAKPWTTVTDDDGLVSHLVSLWFTWRHWCHPFIERDMFISAMKSGEENGGVCTAPLVNMILADACFDYDVSDEDNSIPSTEKPLQDLFYEEAKRQAEASVQMRSLPSIQFLAVQWMFLEHRGIDKLANSIMQEMIHRLKQFDKPGRSQNPRTRRGKERVSGAQRHLGYTSWAAFVSTTAATFALQKRPMMEPPTKDKPPLCQGEPGDVWIPYPRDQPQVHAHPNCHLHHSSTLYEICYNISQYLFVDDNPNTTSTTRDSLEELHRDLTLWYDSLSDCVQVNGVKAPHTWSLHAQYHWAVLVLSELIFTLQADDEDDATLSLLVPVVRAQHMTSALAIADLVHLQSIYWGVDHIPISFLQPVNAALSVVMNDLEAAERKSSFIKLIIALHSLSRRSVSAESMLRVLRLKIRQRQLMSSNDIGNLFKDADAQFEGSLSSPVVGVAATGEAVGFGDGVMPEETYDVLVEKWNQFHLGAPSSSGSSSS
ncbi:hypothetical protein PV08_06237 [Exophiala spinifera]|uniref:Zn(2)-C6 fungal-type domain-containing protein n=1 Tax=Exophiala spinifera TaxID=91928 RepID=A0A0D1YMD5_9EURO|nr:uncharacterized protein PV08_06237 [Exophiala spinifera]KIW16186.1 hypothetical protein PV08_06237 [Exophiala spinifera]